MGYKLFGVEFAPLNIPLERRLQTLAVIYYIIMFFVLPPILVWLPIYTFFYTKYWWAVLLYLIWWWYDYDSPKTGARPWHFLRNQYVWQYLKDYFPITLEKTVDLDPNKNYVLGYHPHGMTSVGAFTNFTTEATNFNTVFPGLKSRLITLVGQFWFPLRREYAIALGCCESSKESIAYLLTQADKGYAVVIVVGGASEALDANPGHYDILMSRRKGFVKMAIKYGADLVPVFSFGENDLFLQVESKEGSLMRSIQNKMKNYFGIPPILFHGRGIFNYTVGILPYRKPIHTIVGRPIEVKKNSNPSQEEIDEYHHKYIDGLKEIFDANKEKYGIEKTVQLHIY